MQSKHPQPHDDIHAALAAVSRAIAAIESVQHHSYADAALEGRLSAYGNLCARRALLHQARSILSLLARSLSAPGVLDGEQR